MQGLTILIPVADRARFRAALSLACAQAALGGRVRVFCQEDAATLLVDSPDVDEASLSARGLPTIPTLISAAQEIGVELLVCQTGLAAASLTIDGLFASVEAGGLVGILATLGDDRLIVA